MNANLCMHILASISQDGRNPLPVSTSLWYKSPNVRMQMSIGYLEPLVIYTNCPYCIHFTLQLGSHLKYSHIYVTGGSHK